MEDYSVNLEEMGSRIKNIRLQQRKTQEIFADHIHISTSYLALIENGKRMVSIDVLAQIAKNCYVSVDYLMFGKEERTDMPIQRMFNELCDKYPCSKIERSIRLMKFYLDLD